MTENDAAVPAPHTEASPAAVAAGEAAAARRIFHLRQNAKSPPVLSPFALYGLPGEIVGAVAPNTEAHPAPMLVTLLAAAGAMLGRGPHIRVGDQRHHARLFALVVGRTGDGRKGAGLDAVTPVLSAAGGDAKKFMDDRVLHGLASGEGLIAALSNRSGKQSLDMWDGAGSTDTRALVIEEEFAGLLVSAQRQNATLSQVIRQAWDGKDLHVTTRRDPLRLDEPHVAIIGHVTPEELQQTLRPGEVSNGFANRFLITHSQRSRLLPEPVRLRPETLAEFGERLRVVLDAGRAAGEVKRSDAFRALWARWYGVLEAAPSGGPVFDKLARRGAPQVLRLALTYALLDGRTEVDAVHLRAALAVWHYCEDSIAYVWRMTFGDDRVDRLWRALQDAGDEGLSGTQVANLFSRNCSTAELGRICDVLVEAEVARFVDPPPGQRGRPPKRLVRL